MELDRNVVPGSESRDGGGMAKRRTLDLGYNRYVNIHREGTRVGGLPIC